MAKAKRKYNLADLSETRADDRETMAVLVEALAKRFGWTHERDSDMCNGKRIWIHLTGPRGLSVTIDFDRESCQPNNHCLAWHIGCEDKTDAELSDNFAKYQVAPGYFKGSYHRKKCTAFAKGMPMLLDKLEVAMQMANDGSPYGSAFCK